MDNLFCGGKETELAHCHFEGWGHSDCEASESAGVICKDDDDGDGAGSSTTAKPIPERFKPKKVPLMKDLEMRLAGGRIPNEGRVEVWPDSGLERFVSVDKSPVQMSVISSTGVFVHKEHFLVVPPPYSIS